jgi:hypothetical protein
MYECFAVYMVVDDRGEEERNELNDLSLYRPARNGAFRADSKGGRLISRDISRGFSSHFEFKAMDLLGLLAVHSSVKVRSP